MPLPRSLAAGCAVVLLVGCTPGSKPAPTPAPLVVWVDAASRSVVDDVVARFQRDTGKNVQVDTLTQAESLSRFMSQNGKRAGADVVLAAADNTGTLVTGGYAAPVELGSHRGDVLPVSVAALTYAGKVYGMPVATENVALVRNTDLVPDPPANFADLLAAGAKLREAKKVDATIAAGDPTANPPLADPYHLYPLQASLGAPLFGINPDGTWDGKPALNSDGGAQFAQLLARMGAQHDYDPTLTSERALAAFSAGRLPFLITGPWNLPALKKSGVPFSVEAVPKTGERPASPFVRVEAFFISAKAHDAVAAQKLVIDYLGANDVQGRLAAATGRLPAATEAHAVAGDAELQGFAKAGADGLAVPNLPVMGQLWNDWASTEGRLLAGKSTDPVADWRALAQTMKSKTS